ncbi:MAG: hypothetical protein RIR87_1735 [Actinomycetota bacterium]
MVPGLPAEDRCARPVPSPHRRARGRRVELERAVGIGVACERDRLVLDGGAGPHRIADGNGVRESIRGPIHHCNLRSRTSQGCNHRPRRCASANYAHERCVGTSSSQGIDTAQAVGVVANETTFCRAHHGIDGAHQLRLGSHFIESGNHHFFVRHRDGKSGDSQHPHCVDGCSGVLRIHFERAVHPIVAVGLEHRVMDDGRQTVPHRAADDCGNARGGRHVHGRTPAACAAATLRSCNRYVVANACRPSRSEST